MNKDLQTLLKYPEYHALKQELLDFCNGLDNISDIDLSQTGRVDLDTEIVGRIFASKKVKDLLFKLGMLDQEDLKRTDKTYE